MYKYLSDRIKNFVVTLRVSILSIFVLLFFLIMITLVFIYHGNITKIVLRGALLLMNRASYSVLYDLDLQLRPAETMSQMSARYIEDNIIDLNNESEVINYMSQILKNMPLVEGVFWGDTFGNFIYTSRDENDGFATQFVNRRTTPPNATTVLVDKGRYVIQRSPTAVMIDPRSRPWFQLAVAKRNSIWTDAYIFRPQDLLGLTVASPAFYGNGEVMGVFGVDIRLDYLAQYIKKEKVGRYGEIFLLDRLGNILSSSTNIELPHLAKGEYLNVNNVSRKWLSQAFERYQRTRTTNMQFEVDGVTYLATFIPIPLLKDNDWVIGVVDVAWDFTQQIHQVQLIYVVVFVLIFVAGLFLVSHLVTRVITPIKRLLAETERIKHFDLTTTERVQSHIKEVIDLSNSIYSMKHGLRSFQKYVPASLVRKLIRTGEDAHIGGAKKELVIFFSDIQDFTTITEKYDSNKLVKQVCDYLETLTHVITQNRGTIDKYIGDSIMAFWGAPVTVDNPCQLAARAALRCLQFSEVLNTDWRFKGKPLFLTRVGLNYGDAIVGSLGSSERLNYTVLGDTVNTASRLVDANKLYGTKILVTEAVYQEIKDSYVLRFVDQVTFKGKAESISIYELLAEMRQRVSFDVDAYNEQFKLGFEVYQAQQWQAAIAHLKLCLTIYPEDTVAPLFIARCQKYIKRPPQQWDGIWHILEK